MNFISRGRAHVTWARDQAGHTHTNDGATSNRSLANQGRPTDRQRRYHFRWARARCTTGHVTCCCLSVACLCPSPPPPHTRIAHPLLRPHTKPAARRLCADDMKDPASGKKIMSSVCTWWLKATT